MNKTYEQLQEEANKYIGLTIHEAKVRLATEDKSYRVMHEDGQSFVGTCDYQPDRVNFSVENGIVTEASIG